MFFLVQNFVVNLELNAASSSDSKKNISSSGLDSKEEFSKLLDAYNKLSEKNSKLGDARDNWLNLENKFSDLSKKADKSFKPNVLLYKGKVSDGLARRSLSSSDFNRAISNYSNLIKSYPNSKEASTSLVLSMRLSIYFKKYANAVNFYNELNLNYPKSSAIFEAKELLKLVPAKFIQTSSKKPQDASNSARQVERAPSKPSSKPRAATGNKINNAITEQLGYSIKTVLIDAGHGGKDPGALGNGIVEKLLVLNLSKKIGNILEKKGIKVIYTRKSDVFIPLEKRTEIANDSNVDLFISLHINANLDTSINGLETYYLDVTQNKNAQLVAARENGVSAGEVSDLQAIISDLTLNSKVEESRELAKFVHNNILSSVKNNKSSLHNHGVRTAPFYVLMGAKMPAILIEFGYLTHSGDAAKLKSDNFQNILAKGVANGILLYKNKLEKLSSK